MLFNSWIFIVFFVFVYLVYLRLSHRGQNRLLLVASYVFYGAWDYRFLSLIALSTLTDFFCGQRIAADRRNGALFLWLSMGINLGCLGFFKYYDFFAVSLHDLFLAFGVQLDVPLLNLVLPVGISFYTFQTMSYTLDVYRRETPPCESLLDFSVFVAFFPQLVAGPIERAGHLLKQISFPRHLDMATLSKGGLLCIQGYFLKVVVADNAAIIADAAFRDSQPSGAMAILGCYAFTLQIFGDFGGYSQIARGVAKLLGIDLMLNFRQPYLATNPSDFWARWHISLSSWLRDYLYIPLGGSRRTMGRVVTNLMITMLLAGLWHGAAWKYVVWGGFHGILLCLYHLSRPVFARRPGKSLVPRPILIFLFFHLICFSWIIFRCESIAQVMTFPVAMFLGDGWNNTTLILARQLAALYSIVAIMELCLEYKEKLVTWLGPCRGLPSPLVTVGAYGGLVTVFLTVLFLYGVRDGTQFIYFQF